MDSWAGADLYFVNSVNVHGALRSLPGEEATPRPSWALQRWGDDEHTSLARGTIRITKTVCRHLSVDEHREVLAVERIWEAAEELLRIVEHIQRLCEHEIGSEQPEKTRPSTSSRAGSLDVDFSVI